MRYIQPGKSAQNAYIERSNRLLVEDVLDAYLCGDLKHLRNLIDEWKRDYNLNHSHSSLGGISPIIFAKKLIMNLSTYALSENG